jgi:dihydropyrimidinase
MRYDKVIEGGRVATAEAVFTADIAISGGRIAALGTGLSGSETLDATGLIVTPGGVDPHCHIEQMSGMGLMNADTFETATRSAAMGGTTTGHLLRRPGQGPAPRRGRRRLCRPGGAGRGHRPRLPPDPRRPGGAGFAADLAALIAAGNRSLKVFTTYNIGLDDGEILRALTIARDAGALTCIHAENDAIIAEARARLLAEGRTRPLDHAASRPRAAEIEAVARMCRLAETARAPVIIFHVSTAEAVAEIRRRPRPRRPRLGGDLPPLPVSDRGGARPSRHRRARNGCARRPQRTKADQDALWAALARGDLQVVSSDHAPYRFDETGKLSAGSDAPFPAIANGMPGLEVRLPLMFDAMVSHGRLGLSKFVDLTATAPARLYGLTTKGHIAPGFDADLTLWDPERTVTYGADDLHDNVGYNPWEGHSVTGWPKHVLLRGRPIVSDGSYLGTPGSGQWLHRDAIGTDPAQITGTAT